MGNHYSDFLCGKAVWNINEIIMKIGILTFHWATNYGAVLQCYALQSYLESLGHEVEIINYKPWQYGFWGRYLRRPWLLKGLFRDVVAKRKEKKLVLFRNRYLNTTRRYYSCNQMLKAQMNYDVVISGSDQILNPSYTIGGENKPTSSYFLQPFPKSRRLGYAVSFGCNDYPVEALSYAKGWINFFDAIGVRENTGIQILNSMAYNNPKFVVPDPTILMGKKLFLGIRMDNIYKNARICIYILRKHITFDIPHAAYIDDYNKPLSIEQWLGTIVNSSGMITNSYHGMIMAILNHIPFVVLADATHMNDRFNTLLGKLGLLDRMVSSKDKCLNILSSYIDWAVVDENLDKYRKCGEVFFEEYLI